MDRLTGRREEIDVRTPMRRDGWPPLFVASISFLIYLVCWLIGRRRESPA
jgi:hypothetical protein